MRRMLTIAATMAVAVPAGAALATAPDHGNGKGKRPEIARAKRHVKPAACSKPAKRSIKYIFRGMLAKDATSSELVVDLTRVNHHAKTALAGPTATGGGAYNIPMLTFKIDGCTKITKYGRGPGKRSWQGLKTGDRVVIGFRAKRGTAFVDLGTAIRVVDIGPVR